MSVVKNWDKSLFGEILIDDMEQPTFKENDMFGEREAILVDLDVYEDSLINCYFRIDSFDVDWVERGFHEITVDEDEYTPEEIVEEMNEQGYDVIFAERTVETSFDYGVIENEKLEEDGISCTVSVFVRPE